MTREEVVIAFKDLVRTAVFNAGGRPKLLREDGARVVVYPFKASSEFLWIEWGAMDLGDIDAGIKRGGTEKSFRAAVDQAVECLMERLDK